MKMSRIKNPRLLVPLLPIVIILVILVWFLISIFEGEKPQAELAPLPEYVSKGVTFKVRVSDLKMGLRSVKVRVKQDGPVIPVFSKTFPYSGLLNRKGAHKWEHEFTVDPKENNLVQGQSVLVIEIHDFSKRRGGDGNLTIFEHKMVVDTIPPSITPMSRQHNVAVGGSGLIIYRISADVVKSGVWVDDLFFPGMNLHGNPEAGIHICYFSFPYDFKKDSPIHLWAIDRADNETRRTFFHHVRESRFPKDTIRISDRLLDAIISSFPADMFEVDTSKTEKYLFLNRELRVQNYHVLKELCESPAQEKLWEGPWLRMKNAATMAHFGERRTYYYKGKPLDKGVHLGIDLASLARSPIQASNSGRVVFAGDLGIYGLTVVIDHGQGLYTMYGHLSDIEVTVNQLVTRGETIGVSGTSGLATGDHLHFGFLVHGIPVNPIEWWDDHWIRDNVERKLAMIKNVSNK